MAHKKINTTTHSDFRKKIELEIRSELTPVADKDTTDLC